MKVDAAIKKETLIIAAGSVALSVAMVATASIIKHHISPYVILGALLGTAGAVLNFFLMGLSVQKASLKINGSAPATPEEEAAYSDTENESGAENSTGTNKKPLTPEAKKARKGMQASYSLRMMMLIVVCLIGALLPCFNLYATVLPMLFPRIVMLIQGFFMKKEA